MGHLGSEDAFIWGEPSSLGGTLDEGGAASIATDKRDVLNCCGKMPGLRRAGLPGSFNLPRQLRMFPSPTP